MILRTVVAVSLILTLTGCSSVYDIRAVVLGGRLAFVPAETDLWGEPDCIYSITVAAINGPPATPASGDRAGMVANGVYCYKVFDVSSCENPFPVFYGTELTGPPFREVDEYPVAAKPLRIGVVYEVAAGSQGSAYGGGKFMITDERKVVNLTYGVR
jgi:hypothetical protein